MDTKPKVVAGVITANSGRVEKAVCLLKDARAQSKQVEAKLQLARKQLRISLKAQHVVQSVSEGVQGAVYGSIRNVVATCIKTVFGEEYDFAVVVDRRGGKTSVDFQLSKDGENVDLMEASGGGVVDVVSFALRLSAVVLMRDRCRRILILDEPFKFLSADHRGKMADLLETLSSDMGMQIIMVTHASEFCVGKVVRI